MVGGSGESDLMLMLGVTSFLLDSFSQDSLSPPQGPIHCTWGHGELWDAQHMSSSVTDSLKKFPCKGGGQ